MSRASLKPAKQNGTSPAQTIRASGPRPRKQAEHKPASDPVANISRPLAMREPSTQDIPQRRYERPQRDRSARLAAEIGLADLVEFSSSEVSGTPPAGQAQPVRCLRGATERRDEKPQATGGPAEGCKDGEKDREAGPDHAYEAVHPRGAACLGPTTEQGCSAAAAICRCRCRLPQLWMSPERQAPGEHPRWA